LAIDTIYGGGLNWRNDKDRRMSNVFTAPEWISSESQYKLTVSKAYSESALSRANLKRDSSASLTFENEEQVLEVVSALLHILLKEGGDNHWFAKLPSHEQLIKRVKHLFSNMPKGTEESQAYVSSVFMNPKVLTLVWTPVQPLQQSQAQQGIYFEDSESDGEESIAESNLPPVALRADRAASHEEYLLTRLRAAKARVEAEQIRMQYFEATGRMPPDSEDEDEDEDGDESE
jgi:hypothetical protein